MLLQEDLKPTSTRWSRSSERTLTDPYYFEARAHSSSSQLIRAISAHRCSGANAAKTRARSAILSKVSRLLQPFCFAALARLRIARVSHFGDFRRRAARSGTSTVTERPLFSVRYRSTTDFGIRKTR